MVVVQLDFPISVVLLLDLVDVVVGEVSGHIISDLFWYDAGWHNAID